MKTVIATTRFESINEETMKNLKQTYKAGGLIIIMKLIPIWLLYNAVDVLLLPIRGDYLTEPPHCLRHYPRERWSSEQKA